MNVVGRVSSFITQGMYSVATPFHPFGGAVDIIVVKQQDGTFRTTPWYVRFGKFQGVLKGAEKVVRIEVNGVEANFNMYLDNSGEAYFVKEVEHGQDDNSLKDSENTQLRMDDNGTDYSFRKDEFNGNDTEDVRYDHGKNHLQQVESDSGHIFYEFQDEQSSLDGSLEFSEYGSSRYDTLDSLEHALESQNSNSEVVLVSVDGHIMTAPISSSERDGENVQRSTPQFHLGPGGGTEEYNTGEVGWASEYTSRLDASAHKANRENTCEENSGIRSSGYHLEPRDAQTKNLLQAQENQNLVTDGKELCVDTGLESTPSVLMRDEVFKSCLELSELAVQSTNDPPGSLDSPTEIHEATDNLNKKFAPRTLGVHEIENGNNGLLRIEDQSSPNDFDHSVSSSSLLDLQVETAAHERTLDKDYSCPATVPVQIVSDEQQSGKQSDIDLVVESKPSDAEDLVSETKHGEGPHFEQHTRAPTHGLEISTCGSMLYAGMGSDEASEIFDVYRVSLEEFKISATSIVKNENLVVRVHGKYLPWTKAAQIVLGMAAFGLDFPVNLDNAIPVELYKPEVKENDPGMPSTPSRRWRLWPIPFRRVKTLEDAGSNLSNEEGFVEFDSISANEAAVTTPTAHAAAGSPHKQIRRTNVPTTDQIASLNLKEGQNMVNFVFCTRVLGTQKVEAHIYLWKWNTRIVISDVDGTITKSDVLGQFMPLVGKDWTHSGIARLFSAIKENGYQLLFLSARAIVQAYLTKSFLFNLKQDGKSLPNGPVVISPDGLFPALYREVIRRAPHEFKIACLEDIKALFPPDYNPFYAGFGNRDTDELSYRKIGIPKGKIFIINPKGEVAINHCVDVKSYTSFHTLVNDMFPPTSLVEQEDYNQWNYWKMPLPDVDKL